MGKWTRRAFITTGVLTGGALIVGVAIRPGNRSKKVKPLIAEQNETVLNIWVKIASDNTITAIIPHAEMGQGVHTSLAMMLADELDADWNTIQIQEAPAHPEYANYAMVKGFLAGEMDFPAFFVDTVDGLALLASKSIKLQITGGSMSVRTTGKQGMRIAGAATKAVLLQAAADRWKVPIDELVAKDSHISHAGRSLKAPYAEFAQEATKLSVPAKPKLKSQEEFTIMGTSPKRLDIPAKVNGTAGFGIDAILPNMKYATIKGPPVFGSIVKSIDESAVKDNKEVHQVIKLDEHIAVVASGYWHAKQGLAQLKIEYEKSENAAVEQADIFAQYIRDMNAAITNGDEEVHVESGDVEDAFEDAKKTIEAEYRVPYLAHACMEPMNATVWIHDGICEVWVGSQNPLGYADAVAEILEMDIEQVKVYNQYLGGGFGRRAETDIVLQAARIAKQVEAPIKLIWSREEDIQQDVYREASISRFKGVLDDLGNPTAWNNQFVNQYHPAEASQIPYDIANQYIHYIESKTHVPWGNWRSVAHSNQAFFTESFIDELAHAANKDPYEYRRDLLSKEPRLLKVLNTAAEKAEWGKALPANWGQGIAFHSSFGSIAAQVAEVEVVDGKVKVHKVVCVIDPGFAIHPDGLIAQMESGIVYGLTAALYGEISIKAGAVAQSNFHDYQMLRMKDMPKIETHIINSGEEPGGAGEPGTPPIAPAVTNAIFAATGKRIRELPIKNQNLS